MNNEKLKEFETLAEDTRLLNSCNNYQKIYLLGFAQALSCVRSAQNLETIGREDNVYRLFETLIKVGA